MDFRIHIDSISIDLSIYILRATGPNFKILIYFCPWRLFAYSADPAEMPHYAAFHLRLHCFPKCLFTSIQNEKDWIKPLVILSS